MKASKYQPVKEDANTAAIVIQKDQQYLENAVCINIDDFTLKQVINYAILAKDRCRCQ
jgi:hypothetical protein